LAKRWPKNIGVLQIVLPFPVSTSGPGAPAPGSPKKKQKPFWVQLLRGPRLISRLRQNPCTPAHGSPNAKTILPLSIHEEGAGG